MGPAVMIIGFILMIIIHEGGHFVAARAFGMKVTEFFVGFGPMLWSMQRGETEYGLKLIPLGGYVRIIGMNPFEDVDPDEEGRTYRQAPFWQKSIVILAGIASHFVVALVLLWFVVVAWGTFATDTEGQVVRTTTISGVSEVLPESDEATPAALSGAEVGDTIIAVDGTPIATWEEFTEFAQANGGNEVVITVNRDGEVLGLETTLATIDRPIFEDGEIVVDAQGDPVLEESGFYGVTPEAQKESHGIFSAVPIAIGQFFDAAVQSVKGLWQMVIGFPALVASLFGGNDEVLETVRPISPIGLVRIAGPLESTLQLLALVNIFVGVLNFVPLYPLDGGHFAVAVYEKITGREPNVQRLLPVAAIVFIFIVSIGLMGVYLDIFKPLQ
ncbi:MAG: site-2 protease family protein [Actinomycetia bacterium]|nr:site-2 protease family protein [Actinomycetes bacterium]